jgi:phospholipase/carboxylesterase
VSLKFISLPAQTEPAGLLVVLHGWGANAQDVALLAPYMALPNYAMTFPNAPFVYPYAEAGRMWYDLPQTYTFESDPDFREEPQLQESRKLLTEWLQSLESTTGIPLSQTILAGFSQGGAMSLDVGLHLPLKALIILSGYLHAPIVPPLAPVPPVLMVHGRQDLVVPLVAAVKARDSLMGQEIKVTYEEMDMGHEIQIAVLELMRRFISESLA